MNPGRLALQSMCLTLLLSICLVFKRWRKCTVEKPDLLWKSEMKRGTLRILWTGHILGLLHIVLNLSYLLTPKFIPLTLTARNKKKQIEWTMALQESLVLHLLLATPIPRGNRTESMGIGRSEDSQGKGRPGQWVHNFKCSEKNLAVM